MKYSTQKNEGFTPLHRNGITPGGYVGVVKVGKNKLLSLSSFSWIYKRKATMPFLCEGFSLIESLVAISILLVSITGPLTIASKGIFSSNVARDQTTAFYLAQEAVEYIRNVRDENGLNSAAWLTGLSNCVSPNSCSVDAVNKVLAACNGQCPLLLLDSNHFYNQSSGVSTVFRRSIQITQLSSTEAAISVTVSWQTGAVPRTFTVRENILNWQ